MVAIINYSLYESDGSALIAKSEKKSNNDELITAYVYAGVTYTIKIKTKSGYSTSASYLFRGKLYTTQRVGKVFTFNALTGYGGFDSRDNADSILPHLWEMGYDAGEFLNNYAATAYNAFPQSDLAVIASHGEAGRVMFKENSYLRANTYIYGDEHNAGLGRYESGDLAKLKLLIFASCHSGETDSELGNLVDTAVNKGVMCCIGWQAAIDHLDIVPWHDKFYEYLYYGYNVAEAISETNAWMEDNAAYYDDISAIYTGSSNLTALTIG